jgi:hypothetical protein
LYSTIKPYSRLFNHVYHVYHYHHGWLTFSLGEGMETPRRRLFGSRELPKAILLATFHKAFGTLAIGQEVQ